MKEIRSRSLFRLLAVAGAACWCAIGWSADAPGLELGGEPAPENIRFLQRDDGQYLPALALLLVGWGVEWSASGRSAVTVSSGALQAQFAADSPEAKVTANAGAAPVGQPLAHPPIFQDGCLWLPVSALSEVLKINVEWDNVRKTLRVGAPTPDPQRLRRWCELLGVPDPAAFHGSGFRVKLVVPQGTRIPEEQEFALNVRTNMDGCVQLYIKNGDAPPFAWWGVDRDGEPIHNPVSEGCPEKGRPTRAWKIERWRLQTTPGNMWLFALATHGASPPSALLDALKAGSPPQEGWAIDALEVTVVPRTPSTQPPR